MSSNTLSVERWPQAARVAWERWPLLAVAALAAVVVTILFHRTLDYLYANWHREEYSHGFLIPPLSAYLVWRRRALLQRVSREGSWAGFVLVVLGISLYVLTFFATVVGADAYALVVVIAGFALAVLGWQGFRVALVPIALLLLMNPLPTFWYNNLSSELQLVSSQLGVAIMRVFDVSVFLDGNVIDLGDYKLQVAEACSGLRYLFPLMTLGAVIAYLYKGKPWTRWLVFVSSLPITVLMNSIRIGIIGILVDRFGIAQAEGFLHQFEGWAIFMACVGLLLLECRLLLRVTGDPRPLMQVIAFEGPAVRVVVRPKGPEGSGAAGHGPRGRLLPAASAALVLMLAIYPVHALPQRTEIKPQRLDFSVFPSHIGGWIGRRSTLEPVYLDQLKLDDYLLADFVRPGASAALAEPVNLYVAYYASQRTGEAVHSPSSCLPGSGWRIEQFEQRDVPGVRLRTGPLRVNRAVIGKGTDRLLVYYWFQERGRDLTNEYLVKWYLFDDALLRDRTDGALVRLVTPLRDGEVPGGGDARLAQFAAAVVPVLHPYIPE
ncbi:MAG TPA: VPLPA-CTERM-specific exosortase XrtD [Steroidobacteraceae bacterium]|nr:VPLPA-CTERM-specific exosortase XrtD [Steroidobacteraceae bacterium]